MRVLKIPLFVSEKNKRMKKKKKRVKLIPVNMRNKDRGYRRTRGSGKMQIGGLSPRHTYVAGIIMFILNNLKGKMPAFARSLST